MKSIFPAIAALSILSGCLSAADNDRLGAQLAATDARIPGCIDAAGITGQYRVRTEFLGHGAGAIVLRTVQSGQNVTDGQAAQATSCINA
ncbi:MULTISPECIES: hypothetical protein [unclassified Leisingera]|uniref:hypothetical protein n=1 Tax=unclassified Leisingera TaxID=2614906 RepID=UPI001F213DE1|nr:MULTISPECIES: hypothetical protein [unclassified Leisingera]MCF6430790.1 hypothetical protein [Leisingera sp. MMG026]UWQ27917.1 hypothetical protein K3557_14190 [Leisingera sp. M523]